MNDTQPPVALCSARTNLTIGLGVVALMGLSDSTYAAADYLLSKDNSEAAAAIRSQLAADYYGADNIPDTIPAAVFGSEPDTPQSRLAAAQAASDAAAATLAAAQAEQPVEQPAPAAPVEGTATATPSFSAP